MLEQEFGDVIFLHDYVVKWGREHLKVVLKMLNMSI